MSIDPPSGIGMPEGIDVRGIKYRLCLLKITGKDSLGIPRTLMLMGPEETVTIGEGVAFITAYIQEKVVT